jgi:cysteinyl-tRNA synthetase
MSRSQETFEPLEQGHVRMYTCGPTVYNYAHIGNFRAYIFEDLLRRTLKYAGYRVTQVMNLTDVDDKTIRGSLETGLPLKEFTKQYIDAFFDDIDTLRIERAEHYPAATDHVPKMLEIIQVLMDKGYGYQSEDGSVYFRIDKFEDYGKLAHLDKSGLRAGARVVQDEYDKENLADFALWKAWDERDGDVVWDAPWGRGRPGWHIECSAMSSTYLGDSFDIHTGGVDNIFPHHEDEIAQSEAATGKPLARFWIHCAHLVVDGQKMSKSLGNFFTLRDILDKGYSGREIRYVLMSTHYRQALNFSFKALDAARASLRRLDDFRERLEKVANEPAGSLPEWAEKASERFMETLADDLNISGALAAVFDLVHAGNRALDANELGAAGAAAVLDLLKQFDSVLGVLEPEAQAIPAEVQQMLDERAAARKEKNFAKSDELRDAILAAGYIVKDTPDGQAVTRK